ncbi:pectinesterase inhibitor domain containing protein, partial [Tanacetum coccineum]
MMSDSGYNHMLIFLLLLTTSTLHEVNSDSIITSLIKSSCTTTLYPDICYSTLSTVTEKLLTEKDVIELTITKTKETIRDNLHTINNLIAIPNLSTRAKLGLNDCLQMVDGTLQQLDIVIQELKAYPNKKSIRHHANDLKTLMSTTITNKESCLDSLSHKDASSKQLRKSIIQGLDHGGKMCSNVLAMIKDMTDKDIAKEADFNILNYNLNQDKVWPEWLSAGDRKLLQSGNVTPNATVSTDGSGDYTTVVAAVEAAPSNSKSRYVIKITKGVYMENVEIPSTKTNLMFIGDGRSKTIINASKSVAGGSTTFNSATVAAVGERFLARDITFQNAAGPSGEQAVALRVGSDLSAFYKCGMDGYQDTLFVHSNRQFYVDCLIVGTIDFIFGNAAAVFQDCDIQARRPNPNQMNMVTAQGRTDPNQNTGIVVQKCKIKATSDLKPVQTTFPTYLGRPWKKYSRTVVMQSSISDVIVPAGWYPWDGDFALDTLYYREYKNKG